MKALGCFEQQWDKKNRIDYLDPQTDPAVPTAVKGTSCAEHCVPLHFYSRGTAGSTSQWSPDHGAMRQCAQIQKIGWKSKPNREDLYILQKVKPHPHNGFVIFKKPVKWQQHIF